MRKALIVARWEFLTTIRRRSYLFAVLGLPAIMLVIGGFAAIAIPSAVRPDLRPSALVDRAGFVDLEFAAARSSEREEARKESGGMRFGPPSPIVPFQDLETATAALIDERVSAVFVVEADYLQTGRLSSYSRTVSGFNRVTDTQRLNAVADAIRSSLLKRHLNGDEMQRAFAPTARVQLHRVGETGQIEDGASAFDMGRMAGTFGLFILFTMAIFFSAGFLQQATIEDRQNRTFEVLLSSLDADELLIGKILGLGSAGLLQVALYVGLLSLPNAGLIALPVSGVTILALMIYFAIGYLLLACLMAAVGMISRTPQEGAQLSAIWTVASSAPMFVLPILSGAPNGTLARAFSMFPLTGPITMMFRLTMSPDVPAIDIAASMAIGIVSVYLCLRGATKIFRAATLMYGQRATLPELVRWLRA